VAARRRDALLERLPAFMKETTAQAWSACVPILVATCRNGFVDASGRIVSGGTGIPRRSSAAISSSASSHRAGSPIPGASGPSGRSWRRLRRQAGARRPRSWGRSLIELQGDRDLKPEARKLLSFTDNRQDASLQAGHFNDFAQVALLRSALHKATLTRAPRA